MDPDNITLENLSKNFEYFKYSNEIDSIDDTEQLKIIAKCYYKLYLKQQEVISNLGVLNDDKENNI
jgi:hypothetical protein